MGALQDRSRLAFEEKWADESWRDQVISWVDRALPASGHERSGELELEKVRPWSMVIRVPLKSGMSFFKASSRALHHEAAVTSWLAEHHPAIMPDVIAAEAAKGWLLMRAAGPGLRDAVDDGAIVAAWLDLLPAYARLQMQSQRSVAQLLTLGLPDRRPATLAAHVHRWHGLLAHSEANQHSLTSSELEQLGKLVPTLENMGEQLAAMAPSPALNHGDFHDGNITYGDGKYQIFDWGDASLSHPFFSMRTVFVSLENRLGWAEQDPRFDELRQAYFDPWLEVHPDWELSKSWQIATCMWAIDSALRWEAALEDLPADRGHEYEHVLPALLRELIEAF